MIVNGMFAIVTCWPTGSRNPNRSDAVVDPITATRERLFRSSFVKNRPDTTDRARTVSHVGVVPTIEVVQVEVPATAS